MNIKMKYLKLSFIFVGFFLTSCSQDSKNSSSESTRRRVTEFTPFHPRTGAAVTESDIEADFLKEDIYLEENLHEKGFSAKALTFPEVVVKKEKEASLFGWTPSGEYNSAISGSCHFTELERLLRETDSSNSETALKIQNWAKLCEKELSRGRTSSVFTALRFDAVKYDITKLKIKPMEFVLTDQTRLMGLLFLRDDKKRPLVIFKNGLFGDADDGNVLRNFAMHMVEESPFHFLFLGSVTGEQFTKKNGDLFLGGFDEGRQIVRAAQDISSRPELTPLIEDIHTVGVSLGSQGALYAGLYSSYAEEGLSKLKSVIAFCPVVNLKPTMESLFDDSLRATFYESLTVRFLSSLYKKVPIISEIFNPDKKISRQDLFKALKGGTVRNYIRKTQKTPWDMEPFLGQRIETEEDYWRLNNFIEYSDEVKIPTLVVHARDDFLVQSIFNSDALLSKTQNKNSHIGVVEFQNGSHCGFNVALSWPTISSMLREYVLKYSAYRGGIEEVSVSLSKINYPRLKEKSVITQTAWSIDKNREKFVLTISYLDSQESYAGKSCARYKAQFAPEVCYKSVAIKLPISDFESANIKKPMSDFEADRLTRWMNTRSYLVSSSNELVYSTREWPSFVRFRSSDF